MAPIDINAPPPEGQLEGETNADTENDPEMGITSASSPSPLVAENESKVTALASPSGADIQTGGESESKVNSQTAVESHAEAAAGASADPTMESGDPTQVCSVSYIHIHAHTHIHTYRHT